MLVGAEPNPAAEALESLDHEVAPRCALSQESSADWGVVDSFALAQHLLELGDYEGASTECRRFLFTPRSPTVTYGATMVLAHALALQGETRMAAESYGRAARCAEGQARRDDALLLQALTLLAGDRPAEAFLLLVELASDSPDGMTRSRASYFAGLCAVKLGSWSEARKWFGEAFQGAPASGEGQIARAALDSLLFHAEGLPQRSPSKARRLSTFVPGLGQAYAGRPLNGLGALSVNALAGFWLVRSIQNRDWVGAVFDATSFWLRYYQGNRMRATWAAEEWNARQQEALRSEATELARRSIE